LTGKVYRYYLDEGKIPEDWWTDINSIQSGSKERIGYPTQKPEALMERIIQCASNEGDLVLDPFMGGGTTIAVAEKLMRRWIGIDQSVAAVKVVEQRLTKLGGHFETIITNSTDDRTCRPQKVNTHHKKTAPKTLQAILR
jgi:DNA modification methylase